MHFIMLMLRSKHSIHIYIDASFVHRMKIFQSSGEDTILDAIMRQLDSSGKAFQEFSLGFKVFCMSGSNERRCSDLIFLQMQSRGALAPGLLKSAF